MFGQVPEPNESLWTLMIHWYVENKKYKLMSRYVTSNIILLVLFAFNLHSLMFEALAQKW